MIVLEWLFLTIAPCDAAEPWQLGSQDAATPMMQGIIDLHHDIFFFLILIFVFVSRILVRALWHFQKEKNPIPQRIVHGTTIEILRTIFPSIIPMFIAIASFAPIMTFFSAFGLSFSGPLFLAGRFVSILFTKIGCPPTMRVFLFISLAKLLCFPDMILNVDSAEGAHNPVDLVGPPGTPLERGEASLPSLNDLPTIVYEQQIPMPDNPFLNVELEKNEMAPLVKRLPKEELKDVIGEDSIRKPIEGFNANEQAQLINLAIKHFAIKNEIIAKMRYLYPNGEWEFTKVIREKFFQGRQKDREYSLKDLQKMLSALNEQGKYASCAQRLRSNISRWNWKE